MFENLEPGAVWCHFEAILKIPRPSGGEEKIIRHLTEFAQARGLEWKKDKAGNLIIYKGATPGYEDRPAVILQGHVDMVCEKESGVVFDFENNPIEAYVSEGWVRARGTTLGADCGIGIAAMLAVLESEDIAHPPLEALFTVDEERGLTGAFGLEKSLLSGRTLINLDSEDEGELFTGCAGGIDTIAAFEYRRVKNPENLAFFRIDISGLAGGHSGDSIDRGPANSNKLLARLLHLLSHSMELYLSCFDGGNMRNAIPREAFAVFGAPLKSVVNLFEIYEEFEQSATEEFGEIEPDMSFTVCETPPVEYSIDPDTRRRLLDALMALPNGVIAMSPKMEGLVETSTNLASVKFAEGNRIEVTTSQRSSIESAKFYISRSVGAVFSLAGASVKHSDGYPGWNPNPDSHILEVTKSAYKRLFGVDPKVRAIHAGLECGLLLEKYPGMDMISFGPTLRGAHSPDESLEIASVERFRILLVEVLAAL